MPTFQGKPVFRRQGTGTPRNSEKCTGAGCGEVATEKSYSGDPMCLNCHQKYDERDS